MCKPFQLPLLKTHPLILSQPQNTVVAYGKPGLLPTPTKAGMATATMGQLAPSQVLPSSTTQPGHHNRAQADSSKKEKVPLKLLLLQLVLLLLLLPLFLLLLFLSIFLLLCLLPLLFFLLPFLFLLLVFVFLLI